MMPANMMKLFTVTLITLTASVATAEMIVDNDVTVKVDCAKDKTVRVSGNKAKITLVGTCEQVDISGNECTVTGSVTGVRVSGNENTFTLEGVDSILVSGNDNKITYKKALKKPKTGVLNSGDRNKISKVK
jgi:hypothetical protein